MKRILKILLYVLLALICLLLIGFIYELIASNISKDQYPPPGKIVDVGENELHVQIMGERTDRPPVVIEAGSSSFSQDWVEIQEELATDTIVVNFKPYMKKFNMWMRWIRN